jgi:hypothetical protein
MIQNQEQFSIQSDSLSSAKFSLKQENLAHVFGILRSNLYSDKILAVIREYSTNAFDAHVAHNKPNLPIELTLPTVIEPTFQVRDFGKGLTEEDVFEIYSSYGASTKRNSNSYVGTLGMGSKAGFAYSPSFTITSYNGGMKKVYEAYIDETNIGTIAKVHEEATYEPTGICVKIDVRSADIRQFRDTAYNFFQYFEPLPKFYGVDIKTEIEYEVNKRNVIHDCDLGVLYSDRSYGPANIFVKMGNICYPVTNFDSNYTNWINRNKLILNVKIGEVSFTTSRESLEMTELTKTTLVKYLTEYRNLLSNNWQSEINSATSPWGAICNYHKLPSLGRAVLENNLVWKNKKLNITLPNHDYCQYYISDNKWKRMYNICYDSNLALIINDGGYPPSQFRARLMEARAQLLKQNKEAQIAYAKCAVAESNALLAMKEIEGLTVVKLSTVSASSIRSKKAFKETEKVFKWNGSKAFPYSTCWNSVDADGPKVYVDIDCFKPVGYSWLNLISIVENLKYLGIDLEIHGVKRGQKIHSDWVSLRTYLATECNQLINDQKYIQALTDMNLNDALNSYWIMRGVKLGNFKDFASFCNCPKVKKILAVSLTKLDEEDIRVKNTLIDFANFYGDMTKDKNNLKSALNAAVNLFRNDLDQAIASYPLLKGYDGYYTHPDTNMAKNLIEYVNAMYFVAHAG